MGICCPSLDWCLWFYAERQAGLSEPEKAGLLGRLRSRWVTSVGEKLDLSNGFGVQSLLSVLLISSLLVGLDPGNMVQSQSRHL